MEVDTSSNALGSLFEKLKLDEPWVPPRSWESLSSQVGAPDQSFPSSDLYPTSAVSEPSLVRLSMNALQGVESALISIEKLSLLLCCSSADRTYHRIPSLWTWCSSTSAVGYLLTSIGRFGCSVFLLHALADFLATPSDSISLGDMKENQNNDSSEEGKSPSHQNSLVNQAFAVCVRKVLDGYSSALNTLSSSINIRRLSKPTVEGCLTSVGHSEITLLEVFLHTTGLRTQIEALGNICNVNHLTASFPVTSLKDLKMQANYELVAFPRGADLLSFLYSQLKVADPNHSALLKFLFLQSYEPYCGFIRSWIYDGRINDPYAEFILEYAYEVSTYDSNSKGITSPWPTIRERNGVSVPCFLEESLTPLLRIGKQLQVIVKFLELCNNIGAYDTREEILPCLIGLSNKYSWFAFPLTFDKGTIERMVLERGSYYQKMLERIDDNLTKFEFNYQQAATQNFLERVSINPASNADGDKITSASGARYENKPDNTVDSEVTSTVDDYDFGDDLLESSECSISETSEGQNETEQLLHVAGSMESRYVEALNFSLSFSCNKRFPNVHQNVSGIVEDIRNKIKGISNFSLHIFHKESHLVSNPKSSRIPETEDPSGVHSPWLFDGHHVDCGDNKNACLPVSSGALGPSSRNCEMLNPVSGSSEESSHENFGNQLPHPRATCVPYHTFSSQLLRLKYDSSFFSMNPAKNRYSFFNLRPMHLERCHVNFSDNCFDFTSVRDPLKEYSDNLSSHAAPEFQNEFPVVPEAHETCVDTNNHNMDYSDANLRNRAKSYDACSPLTKKGNDVLINASGGGAWESLLGGFGNIIRSSPRDHRTRLIAEFEMPLDFVIQKCLLDEILFQYQYLSKLTIKLLTEGFKLREHLVALRRYHFMELADWADMFIMSLWHRKWHVNEADKRIPEIQGFLELSVQRSSCGGDPNKDRLFLYLKEGIAHLSTSINGIHSFDFLGLGYRVDWPVNIILTPSALKIYSEIFTFLIQLKLAVFSLSDAWLSLKSYRVKHFKGEVDHISILTETRHKINHFVSILQQYVQSQLSQVSWCRFLHSLTHKVEDLLDLQSMHMIYLTESLHICFLSNETRSIASIIHSVLQCAMDFQSCLTGHIWQQGINDENSSSGFSETYLTQVHSIRRTFTKNVEELYSIYLQSPKHGEFGISHFWDYLNYNDYYFEAMHKQKGRSIF